MRLNRTHFSVTISVTVNSHDTVFNKLVNSETDISKILQQTQELKEITQKHDVKIAELQGMVHKNCHTGNLPFDVRNFKCKIQTAYCTIGL